jgi:hypothetical protein
MGVERVTGDAVVLTVYVCNVSIILLRETVLLK